LRYTYADLAERSPAEQATALRDTYPGGAGDRMTVRQLREELEKLPDDAIVVLPVRQTRKHGGTVAALVPVWLDGHDIFTQDAELDKPDGWDTDEPEPDAGLPRTGVLYGVMLDPDPEAPWRRT
jgi:hypothetical protein